MERLLSVRRKVPVSCAAHEISGNWDVWLRTGITPSVALRLVFFRRRHGLSSWKRNRDQGPPLAPPRTCLVRSGNLVSHRGITDATGAAGRDSRPRAGPQGGLGLRTTRALQQSEEHIRPKRAGGRCWLRQRSGGVFDDIDQGCDGEWFEEIGTAALNQLFRLSRITRHEHDGDILPISFESDLPVRSVREHAVE